ncbi:hypothetical protein, partial [Rubrimonas sp.]|uniref:hypothetical protein n=1 Tax=Rubrimonas sp. TaxID=2036015 RepID=UPI002FDD9878
QQWRVGVGVVLDLKNIFVYNQLSTWKLGGGREIRTRVDAPEVRAATRKVGSRHDRRRTLPNALPETAASLRLRDGDRRANGFCYVIQA